MGRKNQIDGQLSLFDMILAESEETESGDTLAVEKQESDIVVKKSTGKNKKYTPGGFPECTSCWCATCEHSTVGGSVPRSFGEATRPCPSCELCISEGKADVCVIDSAEEGCRYRAEKEGLLDSAEET